jgi:hypothetical protein
MLSYCDLFIIKFILVVDLNEIDITYLQLRILSKKKIQYNQNL